MDQAARARGISPRELADEMSGYFREMTSSLNISNDRFHPHIKPAHYEAKSGVVARDGRQG